MITPSETQQTPTTIASVTQPIQSTRVSRERAVCWNIHAGTPKGNSLCAYRMPAHSSCATDLPQSFVRLDARQKITCRNRKHLRDRFPFRTATIIAHGARLRVVFCRKQGVQQRLAPLRSIWKGGEHNTVRHPDPTTSSFAQNESYR